MAVFTQDITVDQLDMFQLTGNHTDAAIEAIVAQACMVIESISGVFFKAYDREHELSLRDAVWLRKAAEFQTVWMIEQADVLSRQGVTSVSQDGLSVSAPDSLTFVLAPLAKRALQNCSWAKHGTLSVTGFNSPVETDPIVSDNHPWRAM